MLFISFTGEDKRMFSYALAIVHLICGSRACSSFARHVSHLFYRIILVPSDISPAHYAKLFWFHQTFFLAVNPYFFADITTYTYFPAPWLCNYLCLPLCDYSLTIYLCLAVLQNSVSILTVL